MFQIMETNMTNVIEILWDLSLICEATLNVCEQILTKSPIDEEIRSEIRGSMAIVNDGCKTVYAKIKELE